MSKKASCRFEIKSWNETPTETIEGAPKISRARVATVHRGELEGTGTVEYLMIYRNDGTASFVGYETIVGRLGGLSGSFVIEHRGTFENGVAKAESRVLPGSGASELTGIHGDGGFEAPHGGGTFTLSYDVKAGG